MLCMHILFLPKALTERLIIMVSVLGIRMSLLLPTHQGQRKKKKKTHIQTDPEISQRFLIFIREIFNTDFYMFKRCYAITVILLACQ